MIGGQPQRLADSPNRAVWLKLVPRAGFEPARPFGQRILSPLRLPFRHPGGPRCGASRELSTPLYMGEHDWRRKVYTKRHPAKRAAQETSEVL